MGRLNVKSKSEARKSIYNPLKGIIELILLKLHATKDENVKTTFSLSKI